MNLHEKDNSTRDDVLFAFHQSCERPTAEQIIDWTTRYPQFAEDIRAHAAVARDWASRQHAPIVQPDETLLARAYSQALNELYKAGVTAQPVTESQPCESFQQMFKSVGTNVPEIARELDIDRSIPAALVNGGMQAPVGKRFVQALTRRLRITTDQFDKALALALGRPRIGHAKAARAPAVIPRPYEDIVRASGMPADRVQYWLNED